MVVVEGEEKREIEKSLCRTLRLSVRLAELVGMEGGQGCTNDRTTYLHPKIPTAMPDSSSYNYTYDRKISLDY